MVLPEPLSILDIKKADQTISLDGWLITGKPVIGHSIYSISAIELKSNTKTRSGQDSNLRIKSYYTRSPDYQSGAFDHSATTPQFTR